MIDRATVERILGAADIVEVVSDFVTLRKAGSNWKGLCPFHNEKTPSFMVSPSKGIFKCFSCGKGGTVAHFLMEHEQFTFPEALRWLAKKYHIEIHERELTAEDIRQNNIRDSLLVINKWACDYFIHNLYETQEGEGIGLNYFRGRGLRDDTIHTFKLGYCLNSYDALTKEAKKKGFSDDFLVDTGLCVAPEGRQMHDKYRGRVTFPIQALDGKVIAFGARTLSTDKNVAKYMNSPESAVYHKSDVLYGIYQAKQSIQKEDRCFLVEGYMDVISMYQSGIKNVVASSGTSLTYGQIRLIRRFTSNLTVLYDGDMAGIKASLRGINMLLEEGMNIRVLLLPDNDDPDSFARKHSVEEYQEYIRNHQVDFIRFKMNILLEDCKSDPVKKSYVTRSILESISVIPDTLTRSAYLKECSAMLEEREEMLINEMTKLRAQYYENKQKEKERKEAYAKAVVENEAGQQPGNVDNQNIGQVGTADNPVQSIQDTPTLQVDKDSPRYKKEKLLIEAIVRYGEITMGYVESEDGEEIPVSVIQYIKEEMDADQISFETPVFQTILNEAYEHLNDEGFTASKYFMQHPNEQLSKITAQLMSDRYQLSERFAKDRKITSDIERLNEIVPILMIDLKLVIVSMDMKEVLRSLKSPKISENPELFTSQMKKYQSLKDLQKQLTALGGERTITI